MINKEKTIQKMIARYHEIYPVSGKKSLQDCFICLRGKQLFQFRTKDKKIHSVKACIVIESYHFKFEQYFPTFYSIYKFLTQPVNIGFLRG